MKTYLRFNPSMCSINLGDRIIVESILEQMKFLFENSFCVDVSSHQPVSWIYANRVLENKDLSFVMGSNLLRGKLNSLDRQWDINIFNAKSLGPAVLIGVGWRAYGEEANLYTRAIYNRILSHQYIHSVRDSFTEKMLRKMGFENVINTGCATMWNFTPEFCSKIPAEKARRVITTLTDYKQQFCCDRKMLEILSKGYETVYVWIQGSRDYSYLKTLDDGINNIKIVPPTLEDYDKVLLEEPSLDYVGTRLHGGIRAIQKGKRSLIIAVDNRAEEKKKDFNLPVLERERINELSAWIETPNNTDIKIPFDNIRKWKEQFVR